MYSMKLEEFHFFEEIYYINDGNSIKESIDISENSDYFHDTGLTFDSLAESNDQLTDQITTLADQVNAANYGFLEFIAEFDRRNIWGGAGIHSCAYYRL